MVDSRSGSRNAAERDRAMDGTRWQFPQFLFPRINLSQYSELIDGLITRLTQIVHFELTGFLLQYGSVSFLRGRIFPGLSAGGMVVATETKHMLLDSGAALEFGKQVGRRRPIGVWVDETQYYTCMHYDSTLRHSLIFVGPPLVRGAVTCCCHGCRWTMVVE